MSHFAVVGGFVLGRWRGTVGEDAHLSVWSAFLNPAITILENSEWPRQTFITLVMNCDVVDKVYFCLVIFERWPRKRIAVLLKPHLVSVAHRAKARQVSASTNSAWLILWFMPRDEIRAMG